MSDFICPKGARLIPLHGKDGQGKFAIVDEADFNFLNAGKWRLSQGYPTRDKAVAGVERTLPRAMHRWILEDEPGIVVDHINRNPLDNRRSNLRRCLQSHNTANRTIKNKAQSGAEGVYRKRSRWAASITVDGQQLSLGTWNTREDAARARDSAALYYRQDFAVLHHSDAKPKSVSQLRYEARRQFRTSGYVGVSFYKAKQLWSAQICPGNKKVHLGYFRTEEEAARAFDERAKEMYGSNAELNFPEN